jgi:hypothetical protein
MFLLGVHGGCSRLGYLIGSAGGWCNGHNQQVKICGGGGGVWSSAACRKINQAKNKDHIDNIRELNWLRRTAIQFVIIMLKQ